MLDKKKIYLGLIAFLLFTVVIEILFAHPHYHMPWNEIPGADVVLGFGGAWILIFLAKILMANLLQRREDYYEEDSKLDGNGGGENEH